MLNRQSTEKPLVPLNLPTLPEGVKAGLPPPPPGQPAPAELGYTDEDRSALALVGDYRYGAIFALLPRPDIRLPEGAADCDRSSFLGILAHSCIDIGNKRDMLTSLVDLSQQRIDALRSVFREAHARYRALPTRELIYLQEHEWMIAVEWCRLEVAHLQGRESVDTRVWHEALQELDRYRTAACEASAHRAAAGQGILPIHSNHVFLSLGSLYRQHGRYAEAEVWLMRAAQVALGKPFEHHLGMRCNSFLSLGSLYEMQGRPSEAERWLVPAAQIALSLGNLYLKQGRHGEAELWLMRAAQVALGKQFDRHLEIRCNTFLLSGNLYREQGRYREAESFLEKAAHVVEENLPDDALAQCNVLFSLGELYREQGRYREAESFLEKAARVADESLSGCALTRCNIHLSLGNLYREQGRQAKAERLFKTVARSVENELSDDALTACVVSLSLGDLYREQGHHGEAELWLKKAIRLAEDQLPDDGTTHCNVLSSLGDVYREQGRHGEAELWLKKAIRLAERRLADHPLQRCNLCLSLGAVYLDLARHSEAERFLNKAADLAQRELPDRAQTRCNVFLLLGRLYLDRGSWRKAHRALLQAEEYLVQQVQFHSDASGTATVLRLYKPVFELNRVVAHTLAARSKSDRSRNAHLWDLFRSLDRGGCVVIRLGLRRHSSVPQARGGDGPAALPWTWGPQLWREAFRPGKRGHPKLNRCAVRGARTARKRRRKSEDYALEYPQAGGDPVKARLAKPISHRELRNLLSTDQTVLLQFFFDGDDLVVLPIRREPGTGRPVIVHERGRLFRRSDVRPTLKTLLHEQQLYVDGAREFGSFGEPARSLNKRCDFRESFSAKLYAHLGLDELLGDLLRPGERAGQLHLVVIPDDLLYGLPLHAAYCIGTGEYFYEQVGSLRYGVSPSTLHLQQELEWQDQSPRTKIEATVCANPDQDEKCGDYLSCATEEVKNLVEVLGQEQVRVHGDLEPEDATKRKVRRWHMLGNVLWFIGHGDELRDRIRLPDGRRVSTMRPSFFSCDGPISTSRMVAEGYDYRRVRYVHVSCCTLGKMEVFSNETVDEMGRRVQREMATRELEGFVAALTLLGCRRVSSALWDLCDLTSALFSRFLAAALKEHAFVDDPYPHAYAVAFKQGLTEFRRYQNGRYDHELYWAPYVLYGADVGVSHT